MKGTVLIVEDEQRIREFIALYFKAEGYSVAEAEDGESALKYMEANRTDLVVTDVIMPHMNGYELCTQIRKRSEMPIIILTALNDEEQYIMGYQHGADDYMTKPVNGKILVAKANRLLERIHAENELIELDGIKVDKQGRNVWVDGQLIDFSPKEYELFVLLLENKNKVLNRFFILNKVWGYDFMGESRVVDTHVKKIRRKLGTHASEIKTIISVGYKFEVAG